MIETTYKNFIVDTYVICSSCSVPVSESDVVVSLNWFKKIYISFCGKSLMNVQIITRNVSIDSL